MKINFIALSYSGDDAVSGFRFVTFYKINIADPSARIIKGFISGIYWDYCALCGAIA